MEINAVAPIVSSAPTKPSDENHHPNSSSSTSVEVTKTSDASRFEAVTDDGNEIVYRAVDPETGAVLAQVPSEEVLRVAKRLEQMIAEGTIE